MDRLIKFLKDWMLVIGMVTGAAIYLIYHSIPQLQPAGPFLERTVAWLQPALLFTMLFLSFCRIHPRDLKPHRWQTWLLVVQGTLFSILALLVFLLPMTVVLRVSLEAAMLCLICPTATACAVVTGKLGGDMAGVVTYTIFINLLTALLVPLFVPLIHPLEGLTFWTAFLNILSKVFPLLIMPCLAAWAIRLALPRLHSWLLRFKDLPFYVWAFSLTLAIATSTRAIVMNEDSPLQLLGIAAASAATCVLQFWVGKSIGSRHGQRVTAGQALGQKNTVFAIWMGYTFMNPIVSVAGGFYSIWHNVFNSWQLYRARHESLSSPSISARSEDAASDSRSSTGR